MIDVSDTENLVCAVIQAADCEVVGRIRLQKIFYLLDQMGIGTELTFSYYHYGPFSRDLADMLESLEIDRKIQEKVVDVEGGSYSIYRLLAVDTAPPSKVGKLSWKALSDAVVAMKARTSPVIELAATIHWLRHKEGFDDWRAELRVRKPSKATDSRIDQALGLLNYLGLVA